MCYLGGLCSNSRSDIRHLWEELLVLWDTLLDPIVAMWVFNEVFTWNERKGGIGYEGSMEEFSWSVMDMCLSDMHLLGRKFTWSRGNSSNRIDRMLVEADWLLKFLEWNLKLSLPKYLTIIHCFLRSKMLYAPRFLWKRCSKNDNLWEVSQ